MELEHREEQRLTEEYFVYRREIESRSPHKAEGGFDKTWTHWQGDREAAGIGVA
jgi:hypothetical protein